VPADPCVQQFISVVAAGQDAAKIAQGEALLFSIRLLLAVFAFAVVAVPTMRQSWSALYAQAIIVGSGSSQRNFNNMNLRVSSGGIFKPSSGGLQRKLRNHGGKFFLRLRERTSVSSVIKFSCTQLARLARTPRSSA